MRALVAEGGVAAVAGVDPGFVGQDVEDLLHDGVVEGCEAVGVLLRVADSAGEEAVAGKEVGVALGVVVEEGDRAWGVAGQVDYPEGEGAYVDRFAVAQAEVGV